MSKPMKIDLVKVATACCYGYCTLLWLLPVAMATTVLVIIRVCVKEMLSLLIQTATSS